MNYADFLEWLKKQENSTEATETVQAHVSSLNNESKEYRRKLRETEATLSRFKEVSGNETDFDKLVTDLRSQLTALETEKATLATTIEATQKERDDLKAASVKYERDNLFRQAAEKVGADYEAFNNIFAAIATEDIAIKDDGATIKVDGVVTPFAEYLGKIDDWKKRALFPSSDTPGKPPVTPPLPTGGANSGTPAPASAADAYLSANYSRFAPK